MVATSYLARGTALCAALLILWGADGRAWAGPARHPVPGNGVCRNGGDCTPKAMTFGHYQSDWRKWPGELRPELLCAPWFRCAAWAPEAPPAP